MELRKAKQTFREDMASLKRSYTKTTLLDLSAKIMDQLEETDLFQQASCIALYHAIPGEVQTAGLIEKWYRKKRLLLPLIKGNDLQLLLYAGKESLKTGVFGILEPSEDCEAVPESEIDLIIVPGVAFDRQHNRLGRGKGFYDRLLSTLDVPKIGICYDFQLKDQIPILSVCNSSITLASALALISGVMLSFTIFRTSPITATSSVKPITGRRPSGIRSNGRIK